MSKTVELARHLSTLNINNMYKTDFYWTWDKTDDEIDAIFTVADALRDLRERNKSTRVFDSGLGGLTALWIFSRLHPVRLADWDGSLHTGLEGYLMATGLWPVLLLACILLGCGSLTLLYLWGTRRKDA